MLDQRARVAKGYSRPVTADACISRSCQGREQPLPERAPWRRVVERELEHLLRDQHDADPPVHAMDASPGHLVVDHRDDDREIGDHEPQQDLRMWQRRDVVTESMKRRPRDRDGREQHEAAMDRRTVSTRDAGGDECETIGSTSAAASQPVRRCHSSRCFWIHVTWTTNSAVQAKNKAPWMKAIGGASNRP